MIPDCNEYIIFALVILTFVKLGHIFRCYILLTENIIARAFTNDPLVLGSSYMKSRSSSCAE